jgi:hypothetical protein
MATISYDDFTVGDASTLLVHTAITAGEFVTLVSISGVSTIVGWYDGTGTVIKGAKVLSEKSAQTVVGPLASGDKIYLHSAMSTARVTVGHVRV